ncbi:MAG: hypothetical protein KKA05_02050 [Alphaproteobacteria bacterium]|nr:hypothetical protein [Alphaproteobacteria bacterium]
MRSEFNRRALKVAGYCTMAFVSASMVGLVAGLALMIEAQFAPVPPFQAVPTPLTAAEKDLTRTFFGNLSVDTISKRQEPHDWMTFFKGLRGVARGYDIGLYGGSMHADDYTTAGMTAKSVFMHEIAHVWQYENYDALDFAVKFLQCDSGNPYAYKLYDRSTFDDYCGEQQAEMVEDFVKRYLSPWSPGLFETVDERQDALLRDVVEAQFPGARTLRLQYEQRTQPPLRDSQPILAL